MKFKVYNVGMMYDVTNIKTLTITTTIGKHHTSELRSFTMLKHACEFMSNQKICNSITRTENNVLHDSWVIKKIHVVCKDCYVFKFKKKIKLLAHISTLKPKSNQAHKLSCGEDLA